MSPAPAETATQETGVHFSPSQVLKSLGTSANVSLSNPKAMEQTNLLKGNNSAVLHAGNERCLQKNFSNSQADCPSSPLYKSHFFISDSGFNVEIKDCSKAKIENENCRQRFYANTNTCPLFAEKKVKRELFPGTVSQVLADVNKLWDLSVTETEGIHGSPGPKYRLNGRIEGECLSIPIASNYSSPDLAYLEKSRQTLSNKESKAKSFFVRCLDRQQDLINRAKRNKKRLQILLTKHIAEHCRQKISKFVSYETRKAKVSSYPIDHQSNNMKRKHIVADPLNVASNTCINRKEQDSESLEIASGMGTFSASMPSILTSFERQLDSDATGSSSDEEWMENSEKINNCNVECYWLSTRANVGSRWTWLQFKLLELECQIQQLGNLQNQLQSQKGTLVFDEPSDSTRRKETYWPEVDNGLRPAERLTTPPKDRNLSSTKDIEMSPSSPTMLLRNIELQSAQLTEMVSSLMTSFPIAHSPKPYIKSHKREHGEAEFQRFRRMPVNNTESPMSNGFSQKQLKKEWKRIYAKVPSTSGSSSARTRPLQLYYKRNLYRLGSRCTAMLSHNDVYCCNESLQTSNRGSTETCCDKLQRPVLVKSNLCEIEPHFHPVLSLPSDIPFHIYLDALLKNRDIRGDAVDNTLSILKEDGSHPHCQRIRPQQSQSISMTVRELAFSKDANNSSPINVTPECSYDPCKDERSSARTYDLAETVTLNSFNNFTQTEDTTTTTPTSQKSSSQTRDASVVVSGSGTRRRLRSESSYDIDNIVIPMNLVAPLKLERLQYKEIVTPSFKEMVYHPLEIPPNEELEDLSDDAYSDRHEKYEQTEKARWSFWKQTTWPKKSRLSGDGFADWSGKVFPCNEENCSPGCVSPVSWNMLSPNTNETQTQQSSYELQNHKVGQWEQRVFPLSEAAALTLVDKHKLVQHTSLLTHVKNKQQLSQTRGNNQL
ncbi:KAT8 regulatory NSL complex subunit 1-like protein isoform 2-T3 [Mantella aurantiaca]